MRRKIILSLLLVFVGLSTLEAQQSTREPRVRADTLALNTLSTGWSREATAVGYVTAPAVVGLMFVSALVNEWNAGYAGIPASAMILAVPPLIYAGGRSVGISRSDFHSLAKLGWTLYALSVIPTSLALHGFTTEWGASLPLTIASGIFGSASMVAMTIYASSRNEYARNLNTQRSSSLQWGIFPLPGGALATVAFRF